MHGQFGVFGPGEALRDAVAGGNPVLGICGHAADVEP